MGVARGCYLLFPFLLSLASLVILIIVILDQQSQSSDLLSSLYFLRVDTSKISTNVDNISVDISKAAGLSAYYDIGLWNYCSGPSLTENPNFCSPKQSGYYFNPIDVWNLQSTPIPQLVPNEWNDALNTYKNVSKWLFAAYIVAVVATAVTLLLGFLTFFLSHISAFITSIAADVAALFTIGASATAVGLFVTVAGILEEKLSKYGVHANLGGKVFALTWIAAALSVASAFLWTCGCCCGKDREHRRRSVRGTGPSAYQRVPSPFKTAASRGADEYPMEGQGHNHWPGQQTGTAYEPYRAV